MKDDCEWYWYCVKGKDGWMDEEAMMKHFTCTSRTHEYRSDGHCM